MRPDPEIFRGFSCYVGNDEAACSLVTSVRLMALYFALDEITKLKINV